jgi:hypothetical protein
MQQFEAKYNNFAKNLGLLKSPLHLRWSPATTKVRSVDDSIAFILFIDGRGGAFSWIFVPREAKTGAEGDEFGDGEADLPGTPSRLVVGGKKEAGITKTHSEANNTSANSNSTDATSTNKSLDPQL